MGFLVSKAEFDKKVHDILQRPEYVHLRNGFKDWLENLKEKLKEWIMDFLDNAFSNLPSAGKISDRLSTVFIIVGILIIAAIIIFIAVKAGRTFKRNAGLKEILGERIDEGVTTASLRKKASEYSANGDLRLAIRYEYIALLLLLHEKNLVYLEASKTNEEIIQALKKNGFAMLPVLREMADMFNASWYGHKLYHGEDYNNWNSNMKLVWDKVNLDDEEK